MKKYFASLAFFLISASVEALPIGNPRDPGLLTRGVAFDSSCLSGRIGFYGDYVFNRHLQVDEEDLHKDIEQTQLFTNAALFIFNICDRVDIFGTVGGTKCYLTTNFSAFSPGSGFTPNGQHVKIVTDTHLSGSIGARGVLGCWGPLSVGAGGQYFRTNPNVVRVTVSKDAGNYPSDVKMRYSEWQLDLGASYSVYDFAFPYVAVKWAHCFADFDEAVLVFDSPLETLTLHNLKYNKTWGYAVGISWVLYESMSFSVEGRFGGETALYVNGQVRF